MKREKKKRGRKRASRESGGWETKEKGVDRDRRHFLRGKPLKGAREAKRGRKRGVYGCGVHLAKMRCRSQGVSERAKLGKRVGAVMRGIDRIRKKKRVMGPERKRRERESIQREYVRATVRGIKRKRGLPVRGQHTSTNGKTARRLNGKRISG
jgi:small subunit ribosomal protein S13